MNGTGSRLLGGDSACPICHANVQRLFITVLWIPVFPLDAYRVKRLGHGQYLSRRLGTTYKYRDAQILLDMAARMESADKTAAAAAYIEIARLFPNSVAGREAEQNARQAMK